MLGDQIRYKLIFCKIITSKSAIKKKTKKTTYVHCKNIFLSLKSHTKKLPES